MDKYNKLAKNTLLFSISLIGSRGISFIMIPFYTRILNRSDYGKLDVLLTTIALLIPIFSLQIPDSVFRFAMDNNVETNKKILPNSLILVFNMFILLFLFTPLIIKINLFKNYCLFIYSILFLQIILSILLNLAKGSGNVLSMTISNLVFAFSFAIFNIILMLYFKMGLNGYLLSEIFSILISIIYLSITMKIYKKIIFKYIDFKFIRKILFYSIPLIPNALMWWIINASDRYILTLYRGFESTGIYAISYKFPSIVLMVNGVFSLAMQISFIEEFNSKERDKFYRKLFLLNSFLLFITVSFILAIIKPLMHIYVAKSFFKSWQYAPFLLIGVIFAAFSSFYGNSYIASKRTKGALHTSLIGAIVNIILNFFLIPKWGIQAASFSTMVAYLTMWIARIYDTKENINFKFPIIEIGFSLLCIFIQIILLYQRINFFPFILYEIILFLLIFIINYKTIKLSWFFFRNIFKLR